VLICLQTQLFAQDPLPLIEQARNLEKNHQEVQALALYQKVLQSIPTHVEALIRASELCSLIGHRFTEKERRFTYFRAAKSYANAALHVQPRHAEANFVMAVAMGRLALLESGKAKVEAVIDIKKYAEISMEIDPTNFKSYHVLGKWHYEVSRLNAVEKTAIKIFFGGMPNASFEKSIAYYEKSLQLAPQFNLNYLELARAYHANNQDEKALALLRKLETMPLSATDDDRVRAEGKKLRASLE
jgi:tetratricopeptide (TPR) repeat protein